MSLPEHKKYTVKIQVCDFEFETKLASVQKRNFNRWNQRFEKATYKAPYLDVYDCGKVLIHLMDGKVPVCYWKGKVSDFLKPDPDF